MGARTEKSRQLHPHRLGPNVSGNPETNPKLGVCSGTPDNLRTCPYAPSDMWVPHVINMVVVSVLRWRSQVDASLLFTSTLPAHPSIDSRMRNRFPTSFLAASNPVFYRLPPPVSCRFPPNPPAIKWPACHQDQPCSLLAVPIPPPLGDDNYDDKKEDEEEEEAVPL